VAACVSRRFNALACTPALYARLAFERLTRKRDGQPRAVDDAALALLCRRAGASLRVLDLRDTCCRYGITHAGLEAAPQGADRGVLELRVAEDWPQCCVCMEARRDTLSFTCCHAFCAGCGAQMARCPTCEQPPRTSRCACFGNGRRCRAAGTA
jgi:hypothetical protein